MPAVSERDKAITYRDNVLYDDFRRHEDQFPNSSLMTIGIIKGTLGGEGGIDESLRNWTDNAVMNFSRRAACSPSFYVTPSILKPDEWQALGPHDSMGRSATAMFYWPMPARSAVNPGGARFTATPISAPAAW